MAAATGAAVVKEVPWVDAWVRWERNDATDEKKVDVDDNDDDEEELPSPTESYTFTYPNPNNNDDNDIVIELKGFHEDSEQIWNSTGLKLWQSSAVLCQHLVNVEAAEMLQDTTNYANLRVLEVGSGLGRCGLLAHCLSHDNVTTVLTDGDTDTLQQLRRNISNNVSDSDDTISCRQLLWGERYAKDYLSQQTGGDKKHFDLILGSDLIYVQSVIQPLFETVKTLLSTDENSKFLMAHCSRREGNEVELPMVLDVAKEQGFEFEILSEDDDDISLFCFRRRGTNDED
jgi:predicted nicotinamide N-methyase